MSLDPTEVLICALIAGAVTLAVLLLKWLGDK